MTEIGEIPILWQMNSLGELTRISSGNTAPQDKKYFKNGKYPFIRVQHLKNLENGRYPKNFDLINQEAISELKLKKFKKDSIIFPKSGESIKLERRALLRNDSFVANHLAVIDTVGEKINSLFLFYYLSSIRTGDFLSETTMPSLNLSIIKQFRIPIPPLPEQQKIAEILSTADETIQKVNEEITLTEKLKKGLMNTLLTKGIRHTKFKMTEIGEIPEEWEVVKIGDNKVSELVMGQSPPSSSYNAYADGMPFLQGNADFGEIYPSPSIYCTKPLKLAEKGDILLSVRAPVGELNIAVSKCVIGRGLAAIKCKDNKIHYMYLYYYLKYSANRLRSQSTGSTFKAVGKDILSHFEICLPYFEEQQKIAEILVTVEYKLELLRNKKTYLERIKKGLMGDLLTGKVRVNINTSEGDN